jgi:hypothetical protein
VSVRRRVAAHTEHVLIRCRTRSSNTGQQVVVEGASDRALGAPRGRAPHAPECEAEGVSCDTGETRPEYAARNRSSTARESPCARARRCGRRTIRRRGQRPSRKSLLVRCAQAPSRPEGPRDAGRSEAQRLVRRRAQRHAVTRDGRAGWRRVSRSRNLSTSRSASHVTMSERCGQERAAEVVDEESVNGDHNARHRPALPPW